MGCHGSQQDNGYAGILRISFELFAQFVDVFAALEDNYKAHTYGGSGDVKYHLGHSSDYETVDELRESVSEELHNQA